PDNLTEAYVEEGVAVNSGMFDGLATPAFKQKITNWLEGQRLGVPKVNYKLRDWLFSRQRYWGEPFPILHEIGPDGNPTGSIQPLSVKELPLKLPALEDFKPSGRPEPPLGKATDWINVTRNGKRYRRETNTMPQWAGSCWYYLRYIDPKNKERFVDPAKEKYWMPVDLYVGGAEHAVLHLLYSRFWHKILFDLGQVSTSEPFMRLVNQGTILGEVEYHTVEVKSRRVEEEGSRFRVQGAEMSDALDRQMNRTMKKVGEDIEGLRFNTAIAKLIELNNEMGRLDSIPRRLAENFVLMLAPFAPHICEEI